MVTETKKKTTPKKVTKKAAEKEPQTEGWDNKIIRLEKECVIAEGQYLKSKETTKELKTEFDGRVMILRSAIRAAYTPMPLFDNGNGKKEPPKKEDDKTPRTDKDALAQPLGPILSIDLAPKALEMIENAGMKTVGDMAKWTEGGGRLSDLKGIGPSKADKIVKALDAFWAKWRTDNPATPATPEKLGEDKKPETPPTTETILSALDGPIPLLATIFEAAGLAESYSAAFKASGLNTLGDLARWEETPMPFTSPARFKTIADIFGLDPARAKKAADAIHAFEKGAKE